MNRQIPNAVLWLILLGVLCAPVALVGFYQPTLLQPGDFLWLIFFAAILGLFIFVLLRVTEDKAARCRHCGNLLSVDTPVCPSCGVGDRANEAAQYDASIDNARGPLGLSRNEWSHYILIALLLVGYVAELLFARHFSWRDLLFPLFIAPWIVQLRRHRRLQVAYQRYRHGLCVRCGRALKQSDQRICPDCAL